MFSLAEFEAKINEALERNAILESELDGKDELAETVQRLKDEARDLQQELAVRQRKDTIHSNFPTDNDPKFTEINLTSTIGAQTTPVIVTNQPAIQPPYPPTYMQTQPTTKTTNINALHCVSDVLKKVTVSLFGICDKWSVK
jgi:hypothetical protein